MRRISHGHAVLQDCLNYATVADHSAGVFAGLGGGSHVTWEGSACSVGPQSVGHELGAKALAEGGAVCTATDVAVVLGKMEFGRRERAVSGERSCGPACCRSHSSVAPQLSDREDAGQGQRVCEVGTVPGACCRAERGESAGGLVDYAAAPGG